MPFATELTRRLGIRVPIVQGGMMHNPFGVNMTLLPSLVPPDYPAYAQAIIDEGIKIVETAGNSPGPVIKQLKKAGITILHKCTSIRHAQSAQKLGVDFLSIDGFECAGHVGESDITNFILLSRARQSLTEAPIHRNVKEEIVRAQETDTTLLLRRWRNTTRLYKNKVTQEALEIERTSPTGEFQEVAALVSGKRGKQVFENGDPEFGVWTTGQVIGLIHDIPTCDALVKRIEKEAETALKERLSLFTPEAKL
ncbi:unnamed protein product [Clonostachys rosea f. rosea IK726]|uniref:Nitronate monooxygenase domain-containing protein n=2 Tax=Bionectria ochroleuca TaxID=29856 RepID=A0A0B7JXX9_BIOOC|nr:unnamed protein product [Clonostachys rosea f. rosea IK726]